MDQYMICVNAKSSTGDSSKLDVGDFEVYDTEEHANERAAQSHNEHALVRREDAIAISGYQLSFTDVARGTLHNFLSGWKALTNGPIRHAKVSRTS